MAGIIPLAVNFSEVSSNFCFLSAVRMAARVVTIEREAASPFNSRAKGFLRMTFSEDAETFNNRNKPLI